MGDVKDGDVIAVWFSSGAASAVALWETLVRYGNRCTVRAVNNPVAEEDPDNIRFLRDVERWVGQKIELATNPKYPDASCKTVWQARRFMSAPQGAPCTLELKKRARQHWENNNRVDWHVLGFAAEEKSRFDQFKTMERENVLPVLIDAGYSRQGCYDFLKMVGVEPPRIYAEGYPNANCIGCVKATSPTYWNLVRRTRPEIFKDRARQSREIGARLVRYKGKRIFLDELPADAVGRPLKSMTIECGIFCEEPTDER